MLSVPSWQSQCESQTESAVFCKCSPFSDDKTTVVLYVHELVTVYSSSFHPYLGKKCASVLRMVCILLYATPRLQLISETEH